MTVVEAAPAQAGGTELFDGAQYTVPFPTIDDRQVDELVVRIGGTIKLNRNNPEHAAWVEALTLGRYVAIRATAAVGAKGQTVRVDDQEHEIVTHHVRLAIHELDTTP